MIADFGLMVASSGCRIARGSSHRSDAADEVVVRGARVVGLERRVRAVRLGRDVDGPVRLVLLPRGPVHGIPARLEQVRVGDIPETKK